MVGERVELVCEDLGLEVTAELDGIERVEHELSVDKTSRWAGELPRQKDGRMDGWTDGRMDGWTDGRTVRRTDEQTDG